MIITKADSKVESNKIRFVEQWTEKTYGYEPAGRPMIMPDGTVVFPFKIFRIIRNLENKTPKFKDSTRELSMYTKVRTVWLNDDEINDLYHETKRFVNYVLNADGVIGTFEHLADTNSASDED